MSDNSKSRFLNSLLDQEQILQSPHYEEYRSMLEKQLSQVEQQLRRQRLEIVGIVVIGLICGAIGYLGENPRLLLGEGRNLPDRIRLVMGCIGLAGFVTQFWFWFRLGKYLLVDRGARHQVQQESSQAILLELTRKVDALAQRVDALSTR